MKACKCDVLKTFKTVEVREALKWEIRVVKWYDRDPILEKRTFVRNDGEWRPWKQKMLNYEDMQFIQENMDEILELLDG